MKTYKLIEATADEIIANGCTIERGGLLVTIKIKLIETLFNK